MNTTLDSIDLEHDLIQWTASNAVRKGLETPLRDPIIDAVDAAPDETGGGGSEEPTDDATTTDGDAEKSLATTTLQGLAVFTVLLVVLYASLRRLSGDEEP